MTSNSLHKEEILILDFGSQYTQNIARKVRECQVYCQIHPYDLSLDDIKKFNPKGIILSGGPASVLAPDAPLCDRGIFELGIPILGICYGMQLITHLLHGTVNPAPEKEYGRAELMIKEFSHLFNGVNNKSIVWMSHGDKISKLPIGFKTTSFTANSPIAAMEKPLTKVYGLQFHPEVVHTTEGKKILENFMFGICGCNANWKTHSLVEYMIGDIKKKVKKAKVLCALSGGVDSSVVARLVHRALGKNLTCIFIDNGLLRLGEREKVVKTFKENFHINLEVVDAAEEFLNALKDVTDPEEKRKIIGNVFIEVFEREAPRLGKFTYLAQGTLYPDVIESVSHKGPSAVIKTHHNVGGLPEKMEFKLLEPLRELFKDEVRNLGRELGIPEEIINRQPFPGPGLAIRILEAVTHERLEILRAADRIVLEEIKASGFYNKIWQAFAVLLPVKSVGVMGDARTYENVVGIRAVTSSDGMTADWVHLPYDILARLSNRIINEVKGVNRVVYDISSKPPSTIEWE